MYIYIYTCIYILYIHLYIHIYIHIYIYIISVCNGYGRQRPLVVNEMFVPEMLGGCEAHVAGVGDSQTHSVGLRGTCVGIGEMVWAVICFCISVWRVSMETGGTHGNQ